MSSNLKVNSLVPATGTEIGIGTTGGTIDFRCPATFGGNVTIGGTLTYDEVINIDSIGIVTARTGVHIDDSITHIGDTNTKIRFPAADTITAETAGSERVRIDSSGRVLIGHNASILGAKVQSNTTGATPFEGNSWFNGADPCNLYLRKSRGGVGSYTVVQDDDGLGNIQFAGADGNSFAQGAKIQASVDGTPGDGDMPARLTFHTSADGSENLTERLRINSSGRVGIKNTLNHTFSSNSNTLCIGDGGGAVGMTIWTAAGADGQFISFQTNESLSRAEGEISYGPPNTSTAADRHAMMFRTNSNERLRITSAGNIGIGTNNPSAKLHVSSGHINIDSGMSFQWGDTHERIEQSDGKIEFFTGNSEKMTLNGDKLGINKTSPAERLEVGGSVKIDGDVYSSSNNPWIYSSNGGSGVRAGVNLDGTNQRLDFSTGGSSNVRFRMGSSGEMYIGTTSWPTGTMAKAAGRVLIGGGGDLTLWNETNSAGGVASFKLACKEGGDASKISYVQFFGGAENTSDQKGFLKVNVSDANGGGIERLRIKSDGEVLIGTTTDRPVAGQGFNSGSGWGGVLQIEKANPGAGNNAVPFLAITAYNGASQKFTGGISFNRSNHNTQGTQGPVNTNQQLGNIAFNGSDGTNFIQGAEIFAIPEETFATNDGPTALVFGTVPDGTGQQSPMERLRIASTGAVAISGNRNQVAPTAYNDLTGSDQAGLIIGSSGITDAGIMVRTSGQGTGRIYFGDNSGSDDGRKQGFIQYHNNGDSMRFGTNQTERMRIESSGAIRSGTSSVIQSEKYTWFRPETDQNTLAYFHQGASSNVSGIIMRHGRGLSGFSGKMISFLRSDATEVGSITVGASATAFNTSSDYRLKENVTEIIDGITRLKTLKPYRFNFKDDTNKPVVDGFFAHEVTAVPEAITGTKDEVDSDNNPVYQSIDQSKLVPLLTAALQESISRIETLEAEVAALKAS